MGVKCNLLKKYKCKRQTQKKPHSRIKKSSGKHISARFDILWLCRHHKRKYIWRQQWAGRERLTVSETSEALIHTVTRANRKKPSQSWGGKGVVGIQTKAGFTVSESSPLTDRLQTVAAALRCGLTVTETWTFSLKPANKKTKLERKKNKAEIQAVQENGKLIFLNCESWAEKEEEQGQAWGYYRLCCHGNRNLDADARTTEGGQPPVTELLKH